jgi:hypothetical protein
MSMYFEHRLASSFVPPTGQGLPPSLPGQAAPPEPRAAERSVNPAHPPPLDPTLPVELRARPLSAFVHGSSRPLVGLTLYALARATNPDFLWVDVRIPGEEPHRLDPVRLGWVPEDRVLALDRLEVARAQAKVSPAGVSSLIGQEEPAVLDSVTEFLRMPDPAQRLLAAPPSAQGPGLIAVSNAHRLMAAVDPIRTIPILAAYRSSGYSLFVGFAEATEGSRLLFDYVFRLDGESPRDWRDATLTCEKGDGSGTLRVGHSVRLTRLPFLETVLTKALPEADD